MGILKKITNRVLGKSEDSAETKKRKAELLRRCYFEVMEQRRVLSADPVIAAITYLEADDGQDTTPDQFEVTFQGGAATTQLTQFVINGDQDGSGDISGGDMIFDVNTNPPGTSGSHPFLFDAANSVGITSDDIVSFEVSDDGLSLTVNLRNFEAGDKFAFTIDVDEIQGDRIDKIASGVEFEGTKFSATFVDENYTFASKDISVVTLLEDGYEQTQGEGVFYDEYDDLLAEGSDLSGATLNLEADNATGQANRNAAAIDAYELVAKPIVISGTVYHDEDMDCVQDAGESGIGGVNVSLQLLNTTTGQYQNVASTTTDSNGNYEFGTNLNLQPGTYRLIETQPDGYLNVGAVAGTVAGTSSGIVQNDASGKPNVIADIHIPLGGTAATDYDFCEVKPASLSGNVWHDADDDGVFDSGEHGIANVLIQVTRVGANNGVTNDPFAGTDPIFIRTDANGHYSIDLLPPGVYEIVEINNYPPGEVDPLAAYLDGKDSVGKVGGITVGVGSNDKVTQVALFADDDGVEYNFGEIKPAQIGGYVSLTTPEGDCVDPTDPNRVGIEGVSIQLYDIDGNLVATTTTNANGYYEFNSLRPGTYSVVQIQPSSYLSVAEKIGTVDGSAVGTKSENRFEAIALSSGSEGSMYNFCETLPAEISGTVYHDRNDNGLQDSGEEGIGGTVIELRDVDGNVISVTMTDFEGNYSFDNLYPGEYSVSEIQPFAFNDGKDTLGVVTDMSGATRVTGVMENDRFRLVELKAGDEGTEYNFGELRPSSISGMVHADIDGDCTFDASKGDTPLAGVLLELLNANGNVVATTTTDLNGFYSFDDLLPGTYSVRETTPAGFINGGTSVGTVGGNSNGIKGNDLISSIVLESDQSGVNYDFCENVPAEISGTVYHDRNNNGVQESGEEGIAGVRMILTDKNGNVVKETFTDSSGDYRFAELIAGEYTVREIQPVEFTDGKDSVGLVGGVTVGVGTNDQTSAIVIRGGQQGTEYNFGELKLGEIRGMVQADANGDCVFNPADGDKPLAGVTLQLLNSNGDVIATTLTDSNGAYVFSNLLPGEYSVRQIQPESYFTQGQSVGDGGGTASENLLSGIVISSGQKVTQYNFCEAEAAEITGRVWEDGPALVTDDGELPANYRDLFDGIFQQNVDTPLSGVRMQLYYYIDPNSDEIAPRPVTLGEVKGEHYSHMGTSDPNAPVWVVTNANGAYSFKGLQAGNYIVLQSQPDGYIDANDFVGTTTGFTYNSAAEAATAAPFLQIFSGEQLTDAVINIRVNAGGISQLNNFSEINMVTLPPPPELPPPIPPTPPIVPGNPLTPSPGMTGFPGLYGAQPSAFTQFIGNSRGASFQTQATASESYTWHLSVINGGLPRGEDEGLGNNSVWQQAGFISSNDWNRYEMDDAFWTFTETRGEDDDLVKSAREARFGMFGGTPLAGDFDGDGIDEIAVFKDGYWMIDINRNGRWDEADLLIKLGDAGDRPVVGDWDGDGKDDIGIYGPEWEHDREAIARDPGLPNPDNDPMTRPKNVPPMVAEAAHGARVMKLTSFGRGRVDEIDHVFGYGEQELIPAAGDWNGNGIRSIGTFKDGVWQLDMNGDGRFDSDDVSVQFGQAGDIPLVGDFNGDGVDEIAVYRAGQWMIDSNGNREFDATDKVFEMGNAGDKPVVGDWNGDGTDQPGLYTEQRPVY